MTPTFHAEQAPASASFAQACGTERRTAPIPQDGEPLTEDGREEAIKRAGDLMERRYADFARTRDPKALNDAHAALVAMKKLVASRTRSCAWKSARD